MNHGDDVATVDEVLRIDGGVSPGERQIVVEHCAPLDKRLRSFRSDQVHLVLSMKDRDTPGQHTTLEAQVAGFGHFVATSGHTDFDMAINEVRDELLRQLTDAKNKHEPRNNKHLRDNIRR